MSEPTRYSSIDGLELKGGVFVLYTDYNTLAERLTECEKAYYDSTYTIQTLKEQMVKTERELRCSEDNAIWLNKQLAQAESAAVLYALKLEKGKRYE